MMLANYHTHTVRCKHAVGTEREYIEEAIKEGFEILGFSDHVPQPYPKEFVSPIRMDMSELPDYTETLVSLREEYKGRIKILIGYEVEYTRIYFEPLMKELQKYPLDYLILGQHHVPEEVTGHYVGFETDDDALLKEYVDFCIEGMETGMFLYLAHPDLIRYTGDEKTYLTHMERLIGEAIDLAVPLEVNLYGYVDGRNYPCDRFFSFASQMGAKFVVGCDAHKPEMIRQPDHVPGFTEFLCRNRIYVGDNVVPLVDLMKGRRI